MQLSKKRHVPLLDADGSAGSTISIAIVAPQDVCATLHLLNAEQRSALVKVILDVQDHTLPMADFTEVLLLLLEDVSGFEHAQAADVNVLVSDLRERHLSA